MPLYEYLCESCNMRFEEERKISDRERLAICPKCSEPIARLVPSLGSFILKGPGWYGTHDPGSSEHP